MVDAKTLVGAKRMAAAEQLVRGLIRRGVQVTAAAWVHLPESDQWRLVLAMPTAEEQGPAAAYAQIGAVLLEESIVDLPVYDVTAIRPGDPFVPPITRAAPARPSAAPAFRAWTAVPSSSTSTSASSVGSLGPDHVFAYAIPTTWPGSSTHD